MRAGLKATLSSWQTRRTRALAAGSSHDSRGGQVIACRADGARKWTHDGTQLLDLWMGHGALLAGHAYPPVVRALTLQVALGTHLGATTTAEIEWAERVIRLVPSAERVRFTGSGTEATLLAARVARAFTGRQDIVRLDGHFHGWHDEAIVGTALGYCGGEHPSAGDHVLVVDADDRNTLQACLDTGDVAAVLCEPGGGSAGALPYDCEFLKWLRDATTHTGALLVFDEVITGFRSSPGGVQELAGVVPDVTTLAKVLTGGLPGGAVVGHAGPMSVFGAGSERPHGTARVRHTGTFNGHPLAAAAGVAMLDSVATTTLQRDAHSAAVIVSEAINATKAAQDKGFFTFVAPGAVLHYVFDGPGQRLPRGPGAHVLRSAGESEGRYSAFAESLLDEGVDSHPHRAWIASVHLGATEEIVDRFEAALTRMRQSMRPPA